MISRADLDVSDQDHRVLVDIGAADDRGRDVREWDRRGSGLRLR